MSLRLYRDAHVRRAITLGLRLRGVEVITAQEDAGDRLPDPALLDRATALDHVLFSQDVDLLKEAALRQKEGRSFSGLIFAEQTAMTIGQSVRELELIAKVYDPLDIRERIEFLPLR